MPKIVTITQLADMTCISADTLRTYLGHYTLEKFRTVAYSKKNKKCIGYVINRDFKKVFGDYLEMVRGLKFKNRTFLLMKEYEKYRKGNDNEWWKF